ncbi:unnamed protein product [Paramecium sonneborni]|uniref:SAC domain-containing protein n=1 Tax=Paramecium sonneborni TaxID=65129 RepID=A0A8S1KIJ2_9CILI|nr:unnamed protein product [Paramecium sonneborni]
MADASQIYGQKKQLYRQDGLFIRFNDNDKELIIKSQNGQIDVQLRQKFQDVNLQQSNCLEFNAIYGIITLRQLNYLVVVIKASSISSIMNLPIFQAEKFQFIPIEDKKISSQDAQYIAGLQEIFNTKTFYYSEQYDLTNSLQRYIENKGVRKPLSQFWVNSENSKPFRLCNPEQWIPIFISGLIAIKYFKLNDIDCQLCLISRRDKRRMGRRFISRGADLDGNCSNCAETEQIFRYQSNYFSFLQSRGSMPFKWIQKPDLKWAPKAKILGDITTNTEIAQKHFSDQFQLGIQRHILVNLIDKKGTQNVLGNYYNEVVNRLKNDNLKYIWFDFHHECRGMKYQNLSKLINMMASDLKQEDQFSFDLKQGTSQLNIINVMTTQKCIIRTNCVDCLDRTNVVQSVIARHQLWNTLQKLGIRRSTNQAMEPFPDKLEQIFRDIWTLNADTISLLYTGTGALKTDSTKKGKRTFLGAVEDGRRSIIRYFIGNFHDGGIQNNIDVLTDKIDLKKHQFNNRFITGWHCLLLIFASAQFGLWKFSGFALQNPKVNQLLGIQKKQDNNNDQLKMTIAHIVLVATGMFIIRTFILSKYKLFVREAKLNH